MRLGEGMCLWPRLQSSSAWHNTNEQTSRAIIRLLSCMSLTCICARVCDCNRLVQCQQQSGILSGSYLEHARALVTATAQTTPAHTIDKILNTYLLLIMIGVNLGLEALAKTAHHQRPSTSSRDCTPPSSKRIKHTFPTTILLSLSQP